MLVSSRSEAFAHSPHTKSLFYMCAFVGHLDNNTLGRPDDPCIYKCRTMNVILSLMVALILVASPPKQLRALVGQTKQDLSVPIKDLRNAPTMVVVDNRSLHLSTYPWRDFNPGPGWGPDGSPMMVALKVTSADKQPLPSGVRMDRAWVLFGEQSWEVSDLRGRIAGQDHDKDLWINCPVSPVCEVTVRGGPKWGPGVYVDVVVRLTDREGREHFLQAPNQYVLRSD
jgi:hypothetical protein